MTRNSRIDDVADAAGRQRPPDEAVREEAARRYDACHPDDSFADLARRARFSKEDRRLMEDWLQATSVEVSRISESGR